MEEKKPLLSVWNGPSFPKPGLPKTLSWVIGVERLSERFADIPQFQNIQVWFGDRRHAEDWRRAPSKLAANGSHHQIFAVWFASSPEPHWYFMVYPVDAKQRSHARHLMESQAFPLVESWLKVVRTAHWFKTDKHLRCLWDREKDQMEIVEIS